MWASSGQAGRIPCHKSSSETRSEGLLGALHGGAGQTTPGLNRQHGHGWVGPASLWVLWMAGEPQLCLALWSAWGNHMDSNQASSPPRGWKDLVFADSVLKKKSQAQQC